MRSGEGWGNIRPDLTVYTKGGKPLVIEVWVTHEIDNVKEEYLRSRKLACIEYDLAALPQEITYAELKRHFAKDEIFGEWVFNEKTEALEALRADTAAKRLKQKEAREKVEAHRQRADFATWLRSPHAKAKELLIHRIEQHAYIHDCRHPAAWRGREVQAAQPECLGLSNRLQMGEPDDVSRY